MPEIAVTILLIIILIVLFRIEARLEVKTKEQRVLYNPVEEYEKENPTIPPHVLHFQTGHNNAQMLIRLALFRLYRNNELLDYDAMMDAINKQLIILCNQATVKATIKEINDYINEQEKLKNNLNPE